MSPPAADVGDSDEERQRVIRLGQQGSQVHVMMANQPISLSDSLQVRVEKTLRNVAHLRRQLPNVRHVCVFVATVAEIGKLKAGLSSQHATEAKVDSDPELWADQKIGWLLLGGSKYDDFDWPRDEPKLFNYAFVTDRATVLEPYGTHGGR